MNVRGPWRKSIQAAKPIGVRFGPAWLFNRDTFHSRREQALETTLNNLAQRLAEAEIALIQEQSRRRLCALRAEQAEKDLQRLQGLLHHGQKFV
ncbi:hypothetical protein ACFOD4_13995 [Pseudoroseomonas globiformis]|uniref:Uncharacterized protein n=1 Tax=Teichococcus globiformis TaxID=2307229 RepID=A0ABV7G675_9PROT